MRCAGSRLHLIGPEFIPCNRELLRYYIAHVHQVLEALL